MYKRSLEDPEGFWAEYAEELDWLKKWDKVYEGDFGKARVKWFVGGKLNVAWNCLDRHLRSGQKDRVAILWVGESGEKQDLYLRRTSPGGLPFRQCSEEVRDQEGRSGCHLSSHDS